MFPKSILINIFIFIPILLVSCYSMSTQDSPVNNDILQGNQFAKLGKYKEAQALYEHALQINSRSHIAQRNLGIVLFKEGHYENALKNLSSILDYYSNDAEVLYYMGESNRALLNFSDAVNYYQKALKYTDQPLMITKSLAWVYLKLGHPEQAQNLVLENYKSDPEDVELILIISQSYLQLHDYNHAHETLKLFEDSRYKLKSKNAALAETETILLLDALADAYTGLNNCEKAQELYAIILNTRPYLTSTLVKSAQCDLKLNRSSQARLKLQKALSSEPNNKDVFKLLSEIEIPKSQTKPHKHRVH